MLSNVSVVGLNQTLSFHREMFSWALNSMTTFEFVWRQHYSIRFSIPYDCYGWLDTQSWKHQCSMPYFLCSISATIGDVFDDGIELVRCFFIGFFSWAHDPISRKDSIIFYGIINIERSIREDLPIPIVLFYNTTQSFHFVLARYLVPLSIQVYPLLGSIT